MLGKQIHVVADAVFLGRNLIAAEAIEIRACRECFKRCQLRLIIGNNLLIIFLRVFLCGGGSGEHQRVDLLLRLRHGDVLENVGLPAFGASDDIYCGCAANAHTLDYFHIGKQRRDKLEFCQMVRLLFIRLIILSDF